MDKPKKRLKRENRTEWSERVVAIQRVTKVVKGGKKMSFRAIIVVGNEQGKVGVGVGKAGDVITAVKKGVTDGKKNVSLKGFVLDEVNLDQAIKLIDDK